MQGALSADEAQQAALRLSRLSSELAALQQRKDWLAASLEALAAGTFLPAEPQQQLEQQDINTVTAGADPQLSALLRGGGEPAHCSLDSCYRQVVCLV